jgi:uncharacterized Ntn-hydrolase superfamily protein
MKKSNNKMKFNPFAHTYSIVARDPKTGEMGVGVQSHWFSVGGLVSWGEAGVGVVATQSFINESFGLRGLSLLKQGKSPQEALRILLSADEGREMRQLAILDTKGRVAAHTGGKCVKYASHQIGDNFSVQANMMLTDTVCAAMENSFHENEDLLLPERIIACLEAAESTGGDIRGKQSAALLIVAGQPVENKWEDPLIDLRVEDNQDPIVELHRLMKLWRGYEHMNIGDLALEEGDMRKALEEYNAAQALFPDNLEMKFWTAVSLANTGKLSQAIVLFKQVFLKDENWRTFTKRLPEVDLLNIDNDELLRILNL